MSRCMIYGQLGAIMDITEVNYRRRLLRKNRCVKIKNKDIISLYAEDKDVISATGTTIREIALFL